MEERYVRNRVPFQDIEQKLEEMPDNPILMRMSQNAGTPRDIYPPKRRFLLRKKTADRGIGVFCNTTCIPKGSFIAAYKGVVTTKDDPDCDVQMAVGDRLGLFINPSLWDFNRENCASYVNSIQHHDGSLTGGANVCFYTRYPKWPYVVLYAVQDLHMGDELLADYHWFDTVSKEPCPTPNCPSCQ